MKKRSTAQMIHRTLLGGVLALALATVAHADWPSIHRDGTNNVQAPIATTVTDISGTPAWASGGESLNSGCRPIIAGNRVYTVATESTPERIWLKAFNKSTGALEHQSADLSVGFSVSFGSSTTPTVDLPNDALYFASGSTVYRLKASDLTLVWSTVLSAANTDSTVDANYDIVNASPVLGDGQVFIHTYSQNFGSVVGAQIVGLDQATGNVNWYALKDGRGTQSPLYVDLGASKYVIVENMTTSNLIRFQAFDTTSTGAAAPVWSSTAAGLTGFHGQWGDLLLADGRVYTHSTNFTNGWLRRINPADGTVDWEVSVRGSDIPPARIGADLYVFNDLAGGTLVRYNPTTGTEVDSVNIGGFSSRSYFAATNDSFYVVGEVSTFSSLGPARRFSLTGTLLSATAGVEYSGPLSIDGNTGFVYTYRVATSGGRELVLLDNTSSITDWLQF